MAQKHCFKRFEGWGFADLLALRKRTKQLSKSERKGIKFGGYSEPLDIEAANDCIEDCERLIDNLENEMDHRRDWEMEHCKRPSGNAL